AVLGAVLVLTCVLALGVVAVFWRGLVRVMPGPGTISMPMRQMAPAATARPRLIRPVVVVKPSPAAGAGAATAPAGGAGAAAAPAAGAAVPASGTRAPGTAAPAPGTAVPAPGAVPAGAAG